MESQKALGEGGGLATEPQTLVTLPDIHVKFQTEGKVQVAQKQQIFMSLTTISHTSCAAEFRKYAA
jgi:hypothetical protein